MSGQASSDSGTGGPSGSPRILLVSNMWPSEDNPVFGSFVERHVRGLREAGANVTVVANSDSRTGTVAAARKYAALSARVRNAARRGGFDVVVGHYLYPTAGFARNAAQQLGVPLVLVAHGTDVISVQRDDRFGRTGRQALGEAALVVPVSHALESALREGVGLPADVPTEVVSMGIDPDIFMPDPTAREALGVLDGEKLVLFAGNLVHGKGVDVLIEGFGEALRQGSVDRLVVVGEGPLAEQLRNQASGIKNPRARSGSQQSVEFTGRLPQRDLARWMAAADVFVLPSRNEGLGLALLESQASGTPCVATRVGGIPEALDRQCGVLVEPGDPIELADAISTVLASGKDSFRDACVSRAASESYRAKAEEFLGHLERVVGLS